MSTVFAFSGFDAANLFIAAEHLVVFGLISYYLIRLYRKVATHSPVWVLCAFALFWGTGAVMHAAFAYRLWNAAGVVIWLRVLATPSCGIAWAIVLRWIEQMFDRSAAKYRDDLRLADERLIGSESYAAGYAAGARSERDRLLTPVTVGDKSSTIDKLTRAGAQITRVIDQQVIDQGAAGRSASDLQEQVEGTL